MESSLTGLAEELGVLRLLSDGSWRMKAGGFTTGWCIMRGFQRYVNNHIVNIWQTRTNTHANHRVLLVGAAHAIVPAC